MRGEIDIKLEVIDSLTYKCKQYDNSIKEKEEEIKNYKNDYSKI